MNAGSNNKKHDENNDTEKQISTLCTQEKLALSAWGLPDKILQHYAGKGITHMLNWQLECLSAGKVLEGGNLVYSAPTSAGKTLVAEILMAQTIFERNKKVILILPFVSVVREKMFYFQGLFSLSGIKVEGFMGGHTPLACFKQVHMGVCTIEKANSIINKLLEEKNLNCLGLVVVDELHLLGDSYRGYLLELLLTKLKYMSSKLETNIQIVGMSATLPNLKDLANWLSADLYFTKYRPIPLSETLKCGTSIFDKKMNKIREIVPIQSNVPDVSDHVGQLCLETIKNGHSVLIFCPSKTWCENLADEIALFFKRHGCSKSAEIENSPGWILRNQINLEKVNQVIEHLKMTPVGTDEDLVRAVSYGVAFHHAGLTLDERDIIEGSFRNGSLRVLCATSTLSSGVNLPARRVIIRSPMAFGNVIDILMYRQMIGRAGRMGVDSEGESILICKSNEKTICQQLMSSGLKPIESCLGRGPLSSSLKRALLEIVASGIASTPQEVQEYAQCTFLASSSKHDIENPISSCIKFLEENEFIRLQENGTIYSATPLGQACLASSMPPDEGLSLFRELQRARRCFVLDTDLHIIYQVTPYSVSEQWTKLDWLHALTIFENLPESMKRVGELVGIQESFLICIAKGALNPNKLENKIKLSIHRRFYTALALQDLVNEVPLVEVAQKYDCNKGTLQSLQQSAATYAGMVAEFTRKLGWGSVELIFSQFQERLQFGVQRDLCELMKLPLLNVVRARALHNAGYTNLISIANADANDLERVLYSAIPFQTKKDIAGETSFERNQRNKLHTIWITGKADMSVREAAEALIEQSRSTLELEMGVVGVQWGNHSNQSQTQKLSSNLTNKSVSCSTNRDEEDSAVNNSLLCKSLNSLIAEESGGLPEPITPINPIGNNCMSTPYDRSFRPKKDEITDGDETLKSILCDNSLVKNNETDYFASSLNIDGVMNFTEIVNNNKVTEDHEGQESAGRVEESDSSIEIVCEKQCSSEKLSEDLFEEEMERQRNDISIQFNEVPADLFSQSLTFDTQLQKVLDCPDSEKKKKKLANSFNSDDLGFVSDLSPPKLNAISRKAEEATSSKAIEVEIPESLETPQGRRSDEKVLNKSQSSTLKRKNCVSNSPDFIIGSDDSWVEEGHVSKKAKVRFTNNWSRGSTPNSSRGLTGSRDDSDTEIMPTPKTTLSLRNISTKSFSSPKRTTAEEISKSSPGKIQNGKAKLNMSPNVKSNGRKCAKSIVRNNSTGKIYWDRINIFDVFANNDVNESFREELKLGNIVGIALGCRKVVRERRSSIGLRIMKKKLEEPKKKEANFQHGDIVLDGIALYFSGNSVFYLSFDAEDIGKEEITNILKEVSFKNKIIRLFDTKEQIKLFHQFTRILLEGTYEDPKTAQWLLSKSWKEKVYSTVVVEYIPESTKLVSQLGPLLRFSGPGFQSSSSIPAKTRACIEAFLTFHMMDRQLKLLQSKSLLKLFQDVEMPLVPCLIEMELCGFRFDREKLIDVKNRMDEEQSKLSDKACSFARYKFSLASPAAVSKVLYNDLKLGSGDGHLTKRRRLSTNKEALQELSLETNHPLPDIIMDWRKIQSVLSKVLSPLLQLEEESSRLFSTTQLYTATGRLAIQEPNLQNMPRNFSVNFGKDDTDISVRDIFIPSEGCLLLSVDYCQIELRLLAHLSGDEKLIESINDSVDIFATVASQIYGVSLSSVGDELRQKAKKTCYGIIYGIGPRALSHELHMEESAATTLMEDFKTNYKGVTKYLENTLKECRKKGYVSSLMGRRRYIPYINDQNAAIRSESERQAINTTIQGSAADLLKISMVKIREKIKEMNQENLVFNLLLHLHDELLFEVNEDFVETVAAILKDVMENVAVLRVATPVKIHSGPSWGKLRPFQL